VSREAITLQAAEGSCRASVFRPMGSGPWLGVIFFMDGIGYRPVLFEMCERIASAGYVVLLPDLY
jgi:carboxymethylenebutenolidase